MNKVKQLLIPFFIFLTIQTNAIASDNVYNINSANNKSIKQIVEAFRTSIIEKDKEKFLKLFHSETIPWLGVASAETIEIMTKSKRDTKDGKKRPKVRAGNYLKFIDWIVSNPAVLEEKFWDIKIDSDDKIASVYFKYSFHIGDYKSNWGDEAWHLVKTEDGWKINSVIYSMTINPDPPVKKEIVTKK